MAGRTQPLSPVHHEQAQDDQHEHDDDHVGFLVAATARRAFHSRVHADGGEFAIIHGGLDLARVAEGVSLPWQSTGNKPFARGVSRQATLSVRSRKTLNA